MDPVLEQQMVMNGGAPVSVAPDEGLHMFPTQGGFSNGRMPQALAGIVIGSVVTLIALRAAGFRFSFGVNVGGGS